MNRRQFTLGATAVAAAFGAAAGPARAQAQWSPNRPLRMVVAAPPGSTPDATARPLADQMSAILGQAVIVENRPGAGGIVGMEAVAHSAADGYTMGLATQSQMVFNPYLFEKLPYDPVRDLQPVIRLASVALVLAAHPALPADSFKDLIALARNRQPPLQVAVPLLGTPPHVVALLVQSEAGIRLDSIPFKSGTDAVAACRAGDIPLVVEAPPVVVPHVTAGKLKALAVTGTARDPLLPDVPTVGEVLGRSVAGETWFGLVVPKGVAAEIVARLQGAAAAALARPDLRKVYNGFGWRLIDGSSPREFEAVIRDEGPKWGAIIRKAGLKLD